MNARAQLKAGITTVRDLGSNADLAVTVARAVDPPLAGGQRACAAGYDGPPPLPSNFRLAHRYLFSQGEGVGTLGLAAQPLQGQPITTAGRRGRPTTRTGRTP